MAPPALCSDDSQAESLKEKRNIQSLLFIPQGRAQASTILFLETLTYAIFCTGERPFHCTLCEKAFNQKSALQVHMKKHTGERPYKCAYCVMGFTQKSNMKLHMKRAHSYAGENAAPGSACCSVACEAPCVSHTLFPLVHTVILHCTWYSLSCVDWKPVLYFIFLFP